MACLIRGKAIKSKMDMAVINNVAKILISTSVVFWPIGALADPNHKSKCGSSSQEVGATKNAIKKITSSAPFLKFISHFPKTARFAFPHGVKRVYSGEECVVELTVYTDEGDHLSLVSTFVIRENGDVERRP